MPPITSIPVDGDMLATEQQRQDEIDARHGIEDNLTDGSGDRQLAPGGDGGTQPDEPQTRTIQRSPSDEARERIAARFKRDDSIPFNGDMTDPGNLYGSVAQPDLQPDAGGSIVGGDTDGAAADGTTPDPKDAPRMITRIVRGKEVTKSEDEWLELAMKVDAADSYLEESRRLLEDAKQIRAERTGRDSQHPEDRTSTQDDELGTDGTETTHRPASDFKSVVEEIQFGDPAKAAADLEKLVDQRADKRATEGHLSRLMSNDLARSQQALKDFTDANPELAGDELAAMAIERSMYKLYREDIKALNLVDEAQIPTDSQTLANWHRFYRVQGYAVRNTPDLLSKAKESFVAWRGGTPTPQPKPAPGKEAPRVQVNVNRDDRRANIPNNPSRAAAPRRDAPAVQKTNPSSVIAGMRKARGQLVG